MSATSNSSTHDQPLAIAFELSKLRCCLKLASTESIQLLHCSNKLESFVCELRASELCTHARETSEEAATPACLSEGRRSRLQLTIPSAPANRRVRDPSVQLHWKPELCLRALHRALQLWRVLLLLRPLVSARRQIRPPSHCRPHPTMSSPPLHPHLLPPPVPPVPPPPALPPSPIPVP